MQIRDFPVRIRAAPLFNSLYSKDLRLFRSIFLSAKICFCPRLWALTKVAFYRCFPVFSSVKRLRTFFWQIFLSVPLKNPRFPGSVKSLEPRVFQTLPRSRGISHSPKICPCPQFCAFKNVAFCRCLPFFTLFRHQSPKRKRGTAPSTGGNMIK